MCDHPCTGCYFFEGYNRFSACCNYFLITGKRRPCNPGTDCVVRRDGKEKNRRNSLIYTDIVG